MKKTSAPGFESLRQSFGNLELNVPDTEERARVRILEQVAYTGQSEGRAKDLTDLLTDDSFPRVNDLGAGPKGRDLNCSPWFPKWDQYWLGWGTPPLRF